MVTPSPSPNNGKLVSAVMSGLMWSIAVVILSKFSALGGQWVLGEYLDKEDYAIIAVVSVLQLLTAGFREVGLYQQLVAVKDKFFELASPLLKSSHIVNLIGMLLILVLSPLLVYKFEDDRLYLISIAICVSIPLGTLATLYKAKLSVDFSFKHIAFVEAISVLVANASLIFCVVLGMSVYSVAVSQISAVLVLLLGYFLLAGRGCYEGRQLTFSFFMKTMHDIKWLSLSSYSVSLSLRGDYLVLSLLLSKASLGMYFFGFSLVSSAAQLLGVGLNQVLLPSFSAYKNDLADLFGKYLKSLSVLTFVAGGFCLFLLVWWSWTIDYLWGGKWNESIVIAQLITLTIPMRLMATPVSSSLLESLEQYKLRSIGTLVDGLSLMVFATLGAFLFGVLGAAIFVAVHRGTLGCILLFISFKSLGQSWFISLYHYFKMNLPYFLSCFCLLYFFSYYHTSPVLSFLESLVVSFLILFFYVLIYFMLNRQAVFLVLGLIYKKRESI